MIEGSTRVSQAQNIKKWIAAVALTFAGSFLIAANGDIPYLDYLSLPLHEAGHWLLGWGGETVSLTGGLAMQMLIPFILVLFALHNRFRLIMQIGLLWLIQNCMHLSKYAADASTMHLPPFGVPGAVHDWNVLLGKFGWLVYDKDISLFLIVLSVLFLGAVLCSPILLQDS